VTALAAEATPVVLNLPLAEAVLEQVTAHPEMHDQNCYGIRRGCNTTQCIAGWAVVLSPDAEAVWSGSLIAKGVDVLEAVKMLSGDGYAFTVDVASAGSQLLGLTEDEADELFFSFDDDHAVDYLRELIAEAKQATS